VASERRVCGLLLSQVVELAREKPRYGYRRLHVLLRWQGVKVNHQARVTNDEEQDRETASYAYELLERLLQ
jgi:hypothetical protein